MTMGLERDNDGDAPEPLVHSVSHGWSMMGYYYVNVTTGAERGPFPQTIICKDKDQAECIATAIKEWAEKL